MSLGNTSTPLNLPIKISRNFLSSILGRSRKATFGVEITHYETIKFAFFSPRSHDYSRIQKIRAVGRNSLAFSIAFYQNPNSIRKDQPRGCCISIRRRIRLVPSGNGCFSNWKTRSLSSFLMDTKLKSLHSHLGTDRGRYPSAEAEKNLFVPA
jgi:hypothetical protein